MSTRVEDESVRSEPDAPLALRAMKSVPEALGGKIGETGQAINSALDKLGSLFKQLDEQRASLDETGFSVDFEPKSEWGQKALDAWRAEQPEQPEPVQSLPEAKTEPES